MIKIKRLGHVLLKTEDIDSAVEFYCDVLGFELVEFKSQGHDKMAFLSLGEKGHDIDLIQVSKGEISKVERSRMHHIAFEVGGYESLRDAYFFLTDSGVEIIRAIDHVSQKSIYFKDPDGNIVELYHEIENSIDLFRKGREDADSPLTFERSGA
ncbi:VOC family protein [Marinobacterium lacunae]|uniref:VOC family protein n=1 Tax=Marinobacterium lacunae TaxID=1232683 RepID=UPI000691E6B3|nr:VOC family protein [Marinobacterium lacunae]